MLNGLEGQILSTDSWLQLVGAAVNNIRPIIEPHQGVTIPQMNSFWTATHVHIANPEFNVVEGGPSEGALVHCDLGNDLRVGKGWTIMSIHQGW